MFSKSCQYAIRAVIYLARHHQDGHASGVKEIAGELNAPQQFLAKVLQQLVRHDLVGSTKGPNGGFWLEEKHLSNPVYKIIECVDGPSVLSSCILGLPNCSNMNPCPFHDHFFGCRDGLRDLLESKAVREFLL
jgi:Rrf2 family protein